MRNNSTRMGEESIARLLIKFSLPAAVGMLVMAIYNIVDIFFVGMLDKRGYCRFICCLSLPGVARSPRYRRRG